MPSYTPGDVLSSHAVFLDTGRVDSVVPEKTDIPIDPSCVAELAARLGSGVFSTRGTVRQHPINMLEGAKFHYSDGKVAVEVPKTKSHHEPDVEEVADLLLPIDNYFRAWAGLPRDEIITPLVSLIAGTFTGKVGSDISRHFDYRARFPLVSFKLLFLGDPEFASVYYPGPYQRPRRTTLALRALGGMSDPAFPKALFPRQDAVRHIMPTGFVCMEPWNAFHSGPKNRAARGTERGVLAVVYNLARIALPGAEQAVDLATVKKK